jgi:phosphoglycolate phosphatase
VTGRSDYLLLFDIDGTLIAPGNRVHQEAMGRALREVYGLSVPNPGAEAAGQTDRQIICTTLRNHGVDERRIQDLLPAAFSLVISHVEAHRSALHARVLGGIQDLFARLRDHHHLGLVTGNLEAVAAAKLASVGLLDDVTVDGVLVGGVGEVSERRADLVKAAIENASRLYARRFVASSTAVIGDTPFDIEAGRLAGTRCVGVATGHHHAKELADADLVVESCSDSAAAATALVAVFGYD